jgi:hypothetical protein
MDMLEHFEDDLNMNTTNSKLMENFLRVARAVRKNLLAKYNAGEFADPGLIDPRVEAKKPKTWYNTSYSSIAPVTEV